MAELDLDVQRWRMQMRGAKPDVVGEAVLRNYPLRLWAQQRDHLTNVVRELKRMLDGEAEVATSPPQQLLDVAEMFSSVFGPKFRAVYAARQSALDAGLDRCDSRVPLVHKTADYVDHFAVVLAAVDDYCRQGLLQAPPRPPLIVALMDWSLGELSNQYFGADPIPWSGPF